MLPIRVDLGPQSYDVLTGEGLLAQTGSLAAGLLPGAKRCAVITDSKVGPLYGDAVCASLREENIEPLLVTVPSGEPSKCFAQLEEVTRAMVRAGLDRKSFAIALGGGVVGDLAGFAASIYFRGIPYIQIPTTVVSLVDSSVGGKTGINTPEGKNLIGTFHQPRLVIADPQTLRTLPDREFNEGFAEIIKHAAIRDAQMLPMIDAALARGGREGLTELIARNVGIKSAIVSEDQFETKGLRALLNFGHTIGHAIEACAGYGELLHGEAISLGLRAACWLSEEFAGLPASATERLCSLLSGYRLPLRLTDSITTAQILEKMGRDKKFDRGAIRFVLCRTLGDAFVSSDVTQDAIIRVVERLREG